MATLHFFRWKRAVDTQLPVSFAYFRENARQIAPTLDKSWPEQHPIDAGNYDAVLGVGFKLILWYSSTFILSTALLFILAYLLLASTVLKEDRERCTPETLTHNLAGLKPRDQERRRLIERTAVLFACSVKTIYRQQPRMLGV